MANVFPFRHVDEQFLADLQARLFDYAMWLRRTDHNTGQNMHHAECVWDEIEVILQENPDERPMENNSLRSNDRRNDGRL